MRSGPFLFTGTRCIELRGDAGLLLDWVLCTVKVVFSVLCPYNRTKGRCRIVRWMLLHNGTPP